MNYDLDLPVSEQVAGGLDTPFKIMPKTDDAELEIAIMRQMKMCVAMRLHSLLYAACGEVPSVGLSYDPKVSGCVRSIWAYPAWILTRSRRRDLLMRSTRRCPKQART